MSRTKPTKLEPVLIVPDTHAPYHDKQAWRLMLQVARVLRPKHLIHLGDLADFYSVSSHDKDKDRANNLEWEMEEVNGLLDDLDALGATNKRFIEGNHCDRLRRYLMQHPELAGVVTVEKLMRLKERGWKFTSYRHTDKLGKAHLTHDVGVAGRNATFRALDTYQHTVLTAHTHRMCYVVEGNAVGEVKLSASFGWLGDVEQIDYMSLQKAKKDWCLGFGVGYFNPANGYLYATPVPIVNGTCCVSGVLYTEPGTGSGRPARTAA